MNLIWKHKFFLLTLLVASFVIRGLVYHCYLSRDERYIQVDTGTYKTLAEELAAHGRYSTIDGTPNFYRLPGYPLFLAMGYKLFGFDDYKVLWLQIVLACLLPCLLFFLVIKLYPHALLLARLAACWMSLHLGYVLYSGFMMTETLCLFFLMSFFLLFLPALLKKLPKDQLGKGQGGCNNGWMACKFMRSPAAAKCLWSLPVYDGVVEYDVNFYQEDQYHVAHDEYNVTIFFSGVLLGLVGLIRPVGHYILAVSLVLILVLRKDVREKFTDCLLFAFGWLSPVSLWLVRNFMLTGHLFFHTLPGGHFLYLSAARVVAQSKGISYQEARAELQDDVQSRLMLRSQALGRPLMDIEVCREHEQLALLWFRQHPLLALKLWLTDSVRTMLSLFSAEVVFIEHGKKMIDYFAPGRTLWQAAQRYLWPADEPPVVRFLIWTEVLLYLFVLVGCCLATLYAMRVGGEEFLIWFMLVVFIASFIGLGLAGGYARMRLPVEFLLILLGLRGWLTLRAADE